MKQYYLLLIATTLAADNPLRFRKILLERIGKTIISSNDKMRDEKLQYYINSEAVKIQALSSGKIDKYEYLADEEILTSFHQMNATVMKMYYTKQKPSIVHYRNFKNFCNGSFIKDTELFLPKLGNQQNVSFKILNESVNITLDNHAPLKKRYVKAN